MATTVSELELLITGNAKQFESELAKVNKQLDKLTQKKKESESFFAGFKEGLPDLSKMAIGIGAASLAFDTLSNAVTGVLQKERGIAELSAITGITGEKLTALGAAATDLSNKFGGDVVGQIESFKGVLSRLGPAFGQSTDAMARMGEYINTLALAGGIDAPAAMDALTTSMLQYGVSLDDPIKASEEAARMMNVLAAGAQQGAAEIPQVAEAVKQAGVAASQMGISFEEMNSAIQMLATGGKVGSEAGVALRNVLGLLVKQSGPGAAAMDALGTSTQELGDVLTKKGLNAALGLLGSKLDAVKDPAERTAMLMAMFGTENSAAAGIMLKAAKSADGQASAMQRMTTAISGTNSAFDQAATIMNTTDAQLARIGALLQNTLQSAMSGLISVASVLLSSLGGLVNTLTTLGPILAAVAGGFALQSLSIKDIKSSVDSFTEVLKTAAKGMKEFVASIVANPILLATVAVTGLYYGVQALSDAMYESAAEKQADIDATLRMKQADIDAEKAKLDDATATKSLADEYVTLGREIQAMGDKSAGAADKKARLAQIADQLNQRYPGVVQGTANFADNLKRVEEQAKLSSDKVAEYTQNLQRLTREQEAITRDSLRNQVNVAKQEFENFLTEESNTGIGGLFGKLSEAATQSSTARRNAEEWISRWIGGIYGSGTVDAVTDAQNKWIREVQTNEDMGWSAAQKEGAIKRIRAIADARRRVIEAARKDNNTGAGATPGGAATPAVDPYAALLKQLKAVGNGSNNTTTELRDLQKQAEDMAATFKRNTPQYKSLTKEAEKIKRILNPENRRKNKKTDDGYKELDDQLKQEAEIAKIRLGNDRFNAEKIRAIDDKLLNDRIALAEKYEERRGELAELMRDKEKRGAQRTIEDTRSAFAAMATEYGLAVNDMMRFPDPFEKAKESVGFFTGALKSLEPSIQSVADLFSSAFSGDTGEGLKAFLKVVGNQLITFVEGALLAGSAYSTISALMTAGITAIKDAPLLALAAIALEGARGYLNSLAVGTAFVPNDQIAQIHRGEMVIPRPFAEDVRSGEIMISGKDKEGPSARIRRKGGQRIDVRADVGISSFRSARRKSAYYDNARAF